MCPILLSTLVALCLHYDMHLLICLYPFISYFFSLSLLSIFLSSPTAGHVNFSPHPFRSAAPPYIGMIKTNQSCSFLNPAASSSESECPKADPSTTRPMTTATKFVGPFERSSHSSSATTGTATSPPRFSAGSRPLRLQMTTRCRPFLGGLYVMAVCPVS